MKLTVFLLLVSVAGVFASKSYSQTKTLNLNMHDATVKEVLKSIEEQSEFYFLLSENLIDVERKVNVNIENQKIEQALNLIFEGTDVDYSIRDRIIVLTTPEVTVNDLIVQQQKSVSGTVTDETGQPLPGVTVVVKGTTQGTVTNADGNYSLNNIPEDATLVFSFVGMRTQEVVVGNQTSIDVALEQETIGIEEVVAVGYGTLQRNRLSTSITTVKSEKISGQRINSIDRALEGQVAGLSIQQTSGEPGGGAVMTLRGSGSIGANTEPLVVIDGIPFQDSYGKRTSPLSMIDPANIESIDILKDVSATAIYGSRGSSGVILITTKTGIAGETQVTFTAETGINHRLAMEKIDLMNAEEFARWRKESAYEAAAYYGYEISLEDIPEEYRNPEALGEGTDWQDEMNRIGYKHYYNLNITHGTESFKGFYSIGYLNEEGTVVGTDFERLTMQANMDYTPNDFIKIGLNIKPSVRLTGFEAAGQTSETGSRGTPLGQAVLATPVDGPYLDDGPWENPEYFDGKWDIDINSADAFHADNPVYRVLTEIDKTRNLDFQIQPSLQISPLKNLFFDSRFNMYINHNSRERFKPSTISNIKSPPPATITGSYSTGRNVSWQFENSLNYEKSFDNHRISGLAGYSLEHYNGYSSSISGTGFPGDNVKTLNQATDLSGGTWESNWSLISYLMRLHYDYNTKYLFTGTLRRDGSSRFGSNKRWGYFPSASIGWNITKENFFPDPEWLTNLKLRASYGYSGNNKIGNYTWIPEMSVTNYTFGGKVVSGQSVAGMENINLSWEKSSELNTGIDLTLFSGRLNFVLDYYSRITENMLWPVDIPTSSGYGSMMENVGKIRNKGIEFTINSINISKPDFSWETDFNISFNRNKVLDLGQVDRILAGSWDYSITTVGQPMAMFYAWNSLGILMNDAEVEQYATFPDQSLPGTPRYEDLDGNGVIDEHDKMIIGNPWPDFRGGITNFLSYKNWDFSIFMSFAHNFDVWSQLEADFFNYDGVFNVHKDVEQRWRSPEEPGNGRIPNTFGDQAFDRYPNSDWSHNVSFLKIQNVNIGHTFDNLNFTKFRLYCSIQNLHIFSNYKYGNPDASLTGSSSLTRNFDKYDHPLYRTILFGLNMQF